MEEDDQMSPGCKRFWEFFYDPSGGALSKKNGMRRKVGDENEVSLLDHYEWFTTWDIYCDALRKILVQSGFSPSGCRTELFVLHVGCGNSDFCDRFVDSWADWPWTKIPKRRRLRRSDSVNRCSVMNIDICPELIERMRCAYPERSYVVADCCAMTQSDSCLAEELNCLWKLWRQSPAAVRFPRSSFHLVFDKGTLDAVLSAFCGTENNPNAERYAGEALRVLVEGGIFLIVSINSSQVVDPYVLTAEDGAKSFTKCGQQLISLGDLAHNDDDNFRVETIGTTYNMYGFRVVSQSAQGAE
jgi:SAM-dependent methyltransferase